MRARLSRLRQVNRRLRQEVMRSRRRVLIAAGATAVLAVAAVTAGLTALQEEPVELGVGRAGVKAAAAATAAVQPAEAAVASGEPAGSGDASYYGEELRGRRTASGASFDPTRLTAAHRTLPFGTKLRVTNVGNGRSVVVEINDRGPFAARRVVDLSYAAAAKLGMIDRGTARVRLEVVP